MSGEFNRASEEQLKNTVVTVGAVPVVTLMPGVTTHIVPGNNMTLSFARLAPNVEGKLHSHPHEQMIVVMKGQLDVALDGTVYGLKSGDVISIPGDVEHAGITHDGECQVVEIFTPARKDFEEKLAEARARQA